MIELMECCERSEQERIACARGLPRSWGLLWMLALDAGMIISEEVLRLIFRVCVCVLA
jgi:hypothetical protein